MLALPAPRFTTASATPLKFFNAPSTCDTQLAHVMPAMGRVICLVVMVPQVARRTPLSVKAAASKRVNVKRRRVDLAVAMRNAAGDYDGEDG